MTLEVLLFDGLDLWPVVCDHPPCNAEPLRIVLVTNEAVPRTVLVSVSCPFHVPSRIGTLVQRIEEDIVGLVPRSCAVVEPIKAGQPLSVRRIGGAWAVVRAVTP
jgi:hypothetical protein